jgi:hypothetical protein
MREPQCSTLKKNACTDLRTVLMTEVTDDADEKLLASVDAEENIDEDDGEQQPTGQPRLIQDRMDEHYEKQRIEKIRRQKYIAFCRDPVVNAFVLRVIYRQLDEDQKIRYAAFIQATFKQANVKKVRLIVKLTMILIDCQVISSILVSSKVSDLLTIVMIGSCRRTYLVFTKLIDCSNYEDDGG